LSELDFTDEVAKRGRVVNQRAAILLKLQTLAELVEASLGSSDCGES
jgi:hypothetical protein